MDEWTFNIPTLKENAIAIGELFPLCVMFAHFLRTYQAQEQAGMGKEPNPFASLPGHCLFVFN